jgi:hypothetical protein
MLDVLFAKRLTLIKNPSEVKRATRVFKLFKETLPYPIAVVDLRKEHLRIYINERLAAGLKPSSVNREMNVLATPIHEAEQMFHEELEDFKPPPIPRPKYDKREAFAT